MKHSQAVVMQFAKAPVPGKVKTRLHPSLGIQRATELHKSLVTHTYNNLKAGNVCHLQLWVTDKSHPFFQELTARAGTTICEQEGAGLGERMAFAMEYALSTYKYAVVIGSDCPAIDEDYIEQAVNHLQSGCDVVIGPANDGGYSLIGSVKPCSQLFQNVDWGTDCVMAQTKQHLKRLGWQWAALPPVVDIDEESDLSELGKYAGLGLDSYGT